MTPREKMLYQQIHPAKLLTDWSMAVVALYGLWLHALAPALVVMFVPPIVASLIIVRWVNLEKYQGSAFGKYVSQSMTHAMELVRLAGMAVMALGAWYHVAWLMPAGLLIILLAWFRGLLFPGRRSE